MVGVAVVGAGAVSAASQAYGASKASSAQGKAGRLAMYLQEQKYQQAREDYAPYRALGAKAVGALSDKLDYLTSPIEMTQENLEKTPGYQFTLNQGLKAVQNSAAARGLGVSGAALKGASEFTTGLANKTYKDQFELENINRTNAYNRLMGATGVGTTAVGQLTNAGTETGKGQATSAVGVGNAQAAGYNKMGQAVSDFASNFGGWATSNQGQNWFKGLYGG